MPNYTFECKKCGEYFDVTESIQDHDRHRDKCPKCGSKDVRQKVLDLFCQDIEEVVARVRSKR